MDGSTSVTALRGVSAGGRREEQLYRLGITTVGELVRHYPRAYQDRGDVRCVSDGADADDAPHSYILTVVTSPVTVTLRGRMTMTKFRAADDTGACEVVFFNQPYVRNTFTVGARFRFFGRLTHEKNGARLSSPSYEAVTGGEGDLPRYLPVYPTTEGLSQKMISGLVAQAVAAAAPGIKEYIPDEILRRRMLSTLRFATEKIHAPETPEELEKARRRLIYDEFFIFAVRMRLSRKRRADEKAVKMQRVDMEPFTKSLPYALTGAQTRAVGDIIGDLCGDGIEKGRGNIPMARIVIGDVGCGKTAVAAAAAYMTAKNGYQTVLMAPTEILARQHYDEMTRTLCPLGLNVTLLCGSQTARERRLALAECVGDGAPRADLIIGTHALIEDAVKFDALGLVITDEQHRFGAMQRAALSEKGGGASHTLVMSATPIPRTLSLVMYGDLDVSVIDEMPPGRQTVDTFAVNEGYRQRLNNFIRAQITDGHQVYVVCPAVDEVEAEDVYGGEPMKSAVAHRDELAKTFPDVGVDVVHGKMKGADKERIMADFASGKTKILVSTTVIEVGVNVPNATLMIVENAERFGLSQLHQLRGRVGRGSAKSYCVLVSNAKPGSTAYERLLTMKREHDGFKIAERDLALRGPGDFLPQNGTIRQSGSFGFRIAKIDDGTESGEEGMERMREAFADAGELLDSDPTLVEHPELLRVIKRESAGDASIS